MEKTFRTCKRGYLLKWCEPHCTPVWCESCKSYRPRETPLLVDALMKMIRKLSDPKIQGLDRATYAALMDEADYLLERYKEEVGDA